MTTQLRLPGQDQDDLRWMREVLAKRKVKDVTDAHLVKFLTLAEGDRRMAVKAIASIVDGKPYEPLRRLIARRREERA